MLGPKPVKCPICKETLELEDNFQQGDVVYCPDCDEELRIVKVDPPKLKRVVEILEVYKGDALDPDDEPSETYDQTFEEMLGSMNEDAYNDDY